MKGQQQQVPTNVDFVDQTERIGTDVHVITGRMATIICQLGDPGLPEAMLQWTRNGRPLNESHYPWTSCREILAIANVMYADEATYCCSAENAAGNDSACSGLFVRSGPTLRKGTVVSEPVNPAVVYPGVQQVDIGGNAFAVRGAQFETLCPVTFAEPPVNNFRWTFTDGSGIEQVLADHSMDDMSTVQIGNTLFVITTDIETQMSRLIATGNDTGVTVSCTVTSPLGSDNATSVFSSKLMPYMV